MVELVDQTGLPIGESEKLAAHSGEGMLHRAFSVFLIDANGKLLLQRRASTKYHSPGVWTNSCCGHPYPGEDAKVAAIRRVQEELNIPPTHLHSIGTTIYSLRDKVSSLIECEYNHVFVGTFHDVPDPNPTEVDAIALVDQKELWRMQADMPFSVWFPVVAARVDRARRDGVEHECFKLSEAATSNHA